MYYFFTKRTYIVKLAALLVVFIISFALVSCGKTEDTETDTGTQEEAYVTEDNSDTTGNLTDDDNPGVSGNPTVDDNSDAAGNPTDGDNAAPDVNISQELLDTDSLFWSAIPALYSHAWEYAGDISNANLLFCQYYRCKRDKFLSDQWNTLAGQINYEFIDFAEESSLTELTERGVFYEPVAGESIELSHFFASLNLLTKKRQALLRLGNDTTSHPVYDMGTWAGDCLELATDLIPMVSEETTDQELYTITSELFGSTQGHFNRDNILADVDTYNIVCILSSDTDNLLAAMDEYYCLLMSGESRFTIFADNRFGKSAASEDIAYAVTRRLMSSDNIYIPLLREELGIDTDNNTHVRILEAIGKVMGDYIR